MEAAALGGHGPLFKIFRPDAAVRAKSGNRQQAGFDTDPLLGQSLGSSEGLRRKIFMNPLHNGSPQSSGERFLFAVFHRDIVVIACPDGTGVVGGEAHKPHVVIVCGGAGLARHGHAPVKVYAGSSSACSGDNVYHGIGEQEGGSLLEYLLGHRVGIVKDHVSFRIQNPGVKLGLYIAAQIGDGAIGGVHLVRRDTVGQTAQGKCLVYVRKDLSAYLDAVRQGGKAEIQKIVVAQLGGYYGFCLYRDDIHGLADGIADGSDALVAGFVPVSHGSAVVVIEGRIVVNRSKGLSGTVKSRGKGGKYLEGGAGKTLGVRGPVPGSSAFLCAASAHQGPHITGVLVCDDHRVLRLWSHGNGFLIIVFRLGDAQLCHHGRPVGGDGFIGILLGGEEQVELGVLVGLKPGHHVFLAVIFLVSLPVRDGEGIVQEPLYLFGIVFRICKFFICDCLDRGIHGGFNAQTAGGQLLFRSGLVVSGDFHKVVQHLFINRVGEIGAGGGIRVFPIVDIIVADPFVDGVGVVHGFRILRLGNEAQIPHFVQTVLSPPCVGLRVPDGIVAGRILGDGGDDRRLGDRQVAGGFPEITFGGRFHAQRVLSQVDGVHVLQKDGIFFKILGNFLCQILFLKLSLDLFDHIFAFGGPAREDGIFQELLGDGAGALSLFEA